LNAALAAEVPFFLQRIFPQALQLIILEPPLPLGKAGLQPCIYPTPRSGNRSAEGKL
jgi:hypothetical protein